ncbi:MAG TPA: formate--tetrahydrofolate ligase, partial [Hyphomonas adhaerens]|nr:formate--tetrahydrofolate ligase [Hyphomonas adhaerens]
VGYGALEAGLGNLGRHIENLKKFGVPVVVAINRFTSDTSSELAAIESYCHDLGVPVSVCTHWAEGGRGAEDLARKVIDTMEAHPSEFKPLYRDEAPLLEKIETVAREIYRAERVEASDNVRAALRRMEEGGYGRLPVCMAKTQYSFSNNPKLVGAPDKHVLQLREVRLSAGAGFVVGICGDIMTMPGLPRHPAAEGVSLNSDGEIEGLY